MIDLRVVYGNDCNDWISKKIALADCALNTTIDDVENRKCSYRIWKSGGSPELITAFNVNSSITTVNHDTNKRIVGVVRDRLSDGGLNISILGNETLYLDTSHDTEQLLTNIYITSRVKYVYRLLSNDYDKDLFTYVINLDGSIPDNASSLTITTTGTGSNTPVSLDFDDMIDFTPHFHVTGISIPDQQMGYNNVHIGSRRSFQLSNTSLDNTFQYGFNIAETSCYIDSFFTKNPLQAVAGNLYLVGQELSQRFGSLTPQTIPYDNFQDYDVDYSPLLIRTNTCSIPFNIILTSNIEYAKAYLNTGILPPDAFLYPLDFENLPKYQVPDDDGTDGEDDNTTDDTTRDVTPNPPVIPSFTPSMLTNNNYYWLTAPELEGFMTWYWQDVGDISDIDDLLAKIEGLYNNLSQAILNIRYMPVEIAWLGGLGADSNIKIAQIEKAGQYNTISKTAKPIVRDVGHIHIPDRYNSFVDLSPYSQLSVYLPFHGFIDLDINIFSGHDIYVKAIYDFMSGTIQYLIYYDNQFLVTTLVCKMAVDIPISLQTKNDRDSAVFQNVSNVVGGLMGAGLSIGTGNPMGLLVGANALNSGVASAPLNVKGNVGETGAFYAPPQCAIILRRPTISKPSQDIWKSKVGQICGKTYTLGNLDGFTTVYNPQISFKGNKNADGVTMKPLESEIREIYSALEKGVIL